MPDTRIPYGARCTWWDSIDKVGVRQGSNPLGGPPMRLPCCPHCRNMLFEVEDEATWWRGIDKYEADGHPGYRAIMTFGRGKCFPNLAALTAAYQQENPNGKAQN